MKKISLLTSLLGVYSLISSPAVAAGFSTIYGFGDSLTDTGNVNRVVLEVTGGTQTFPPTPPYFMGRFSNGPVWIEGLDQRLNVPLIDSSFGGATSGFENTFDATLGGIPLPGLQQQIAGFVMNNPIADPHALYTIWIGGNDYLPTNSTGFTPYDNPDQTLSNIETAINSLVGVGARNIMVLNLPNLGDAPLNNSSVDGICPTDNQFDGDCLNDLTIAHNDGLSTLLSSFSSEVNLIPVDINTLFNNITTSSIFTNVTAPCFDSTIPQVCNNPDEFLFWDNSHPTTEAHQFITDLAVESLGIPEPNTIVGLLSISLIGMVKVIKSSISKHE
ncbi:MAG: SGNH/GDSL hydrolase family protein [Crocosphaera sp.]